MKGIVVTADNKVSIKDFGSPLCATLGKEVKGDIELVHPRGLPAPFCMVVNEDGINLNLPFNIVGSFFYKTHIHGWPILGTAVFLKEGMTKQGIDFIGLEDEDVTKLKAIIEKLIKFIN